MVFIFIQGSSSFRHCIAIVNETLIHSPISISFTSNSPLAILDRINENEKEKIKTTVLNRRFHMVHYPTVPSKPLLLPICGKVIAAGSDTTSHVKYAVGVPSPLKLTNTRVAFLGTRKYDT